MFIITLQFLAISVSAWAYSKHEDDKYKESYAVHHKRSRKSGSRVSTTASFMRIRLYFTQQMPNDCLGPRSKRREGVRCGRIVGRGCEQSDTTWPSIEALLECVCKKDRTQNRTFCGYNVCRSWQHTTCKFFPHSLEFEACLVVAVSDNRKLIAVLRSGLTLFEDAFGAFQKQVSTGYCSRN